MRFREFISENMFDHSSNAHQELMTDIDHFTASPGLTLKPSTIAYLKSKRTKSSSMMLYRVLFVDSLPRLAKDLNMSEVKIGAHGEHSAKRISSWTNRKSVVMELAVENDDIGRFSVVLKAEIPGRAIVLDTDDLTTADRKFIHLFAQNEIMVDEGTYSVTVIDVIDHEE